MHAALAHSFLARRDKKGTSIIIMFQEKSEAKTHRKTPSQVYQAGRHRRFLP
jgi:hypothetical protein